MLLVPAEVVVIQGIRAAAGLLLGSVGSEWVVRAHGGRFVTWAWGTGTQGSSQERPMRPRAPGQGRPGRYVTHRSGTSAVMIGGARLSPTSGTFTTRICAEGGIALPRTGTSDCGIRRRTKPCDLPATRRPSAVLGGKSSHPCDCVPTPWEEGGGGVGSRTGSGAGFLASHPLQGS